MMASATLCLALNMFFEARNEPLEGQLMVAEVTLNRVTSDRYPDTICEVVWQPKQFSWTHKVKQYDPTQMSYLDRVAWREIKDIAGFILQDPSQALPGIEATHYHADYTEPFWAAELEYLGQVGTHVFYVE